MEIDSRTESARAYERALGAIAGGVDSPVRALRAVGAAPLFVREANGAEIVDVDGNSYVDYCMSWGVFVLGHNRREVSEAAIAAVRRGSSYGIPTESETELAEAVRRAIPSMERLRFVSSGTEATMSAVRLARGWTGRDLVAKFEGNYHGHADHLLVSAGSGVASLGNASSAGVPADFARQTAVLPYNDVDALERFFAANGDRTAALILEPVACNMGVVPPAEGFLAAARRLCDRHGALLVFDEVITGFRVAYGGAQERFGVRPDLTTVGKIVGGGFPAAAFGGRAEIMALLAPDGPVYQAGTLSGNPVAMAAGRETLRLLSRPGFYGELEDRCERFYAELRRIVAGRGVRLNAVGSMFTLFFGDFEVRNFADAARCDRERFARYFRNMLSRGIYVSPSQFEGNFVSACHTEEILDRTLRAIDESL